MYKRQVLRVGDPAAYANLSASLSNCTVDAATLEDAPALVGEALVLTETKVLVLILDDEAAEAHFPPRNGTNSSNATSWSAVVRATCDGVRPTELRLNFTLLDARRPPATPPRPPPPSPSPAPLLPPGESVERFLCHENAHYWPLDQIDDSYLSPLDNPTSSSAAFAASAARAAWKSRRSCRELSLDQRSCQGLAFAPRWAVGDWDQRNSNSAALCGAWGRSLVMACAAPMPLETVLLSQEPK